MRLIAPTFLLSITLAVSVEAAPVLYLNPSSQVSGAPGQTVGWGFTITNPTDYLVVDSFRFSPSGPALGAFEDFSQFNFIDVGPVPEESPSVTQVFSLSKQSGAGSFQIPQAASPGSITGAIVMTYDLYATDPASSGGTPISFAQTLSVPASVVITAALVPEPGTFGFLLVAVGMLVCSLRRFSKL